MARKSRRDQPASWHHVVNRGIAKRPLFESRDDVRFFLSRIAREVREGRIEVHAFCILTTHFHMLVKSPRGELSEAFRRAQNAHSRRFNRRKRRDGALVRGRFFSKRVDDDRYRRVLVRYIDHNPVRAKIVTAARDYEFCSAAHYQGGAGPIWLARDWVEAEACRITGVASFSSEAYDQSFAPAHARMVELVDRRLTSRATREPLTDLIGTTADSVRAWMQRKARLADGTKLGLPMCTATAIQEALAADEQVKGRWVVEEGERLIPARKAAEVGLGHDLAGMSWRELALLTSGSPSQVRRLADLHWRLIRTDAGYVERAAQVGGAALREVLEG